MSGFSIAPALPADGLALSRLEAECFPHPRSEAALLSEIGQPERYLLLTYKIQGRLEGYVGLEYVLDEGYVTDLAVFPRYRRRGAGTALMIALEEKGQELGLKFLTLEVRAGNLAALGLYRGVGYKEVGRRPGFYTEPREDAVLMTRWLHYENQDKL